jgi:hypothetical protein
MFSHDQKRLLALDGGGILGLISLQILKRIEDQLRPYAREPEQFVLRDFFDYIGGTSTGAIIAAGLALGWPVQRLIDFYEQFGSKMFKRAWLWKQPFHKYSARPLSDLLRQQIGEQTILDLHDEGKLSKTKHLLIVTQNISTDSPWPVSTNPEAKYNLRERKDCNRNVPLWQLVRASTAAPTYFPPQEIQLEKENSSSLRKFEDGGVTPYNNPAFLLYRMATLPEYRCGWPVGEDKMMLVSVGTGCAVTPEPGLRAWGRYLLSNARSVPSGLMQRISVENDIKCRTIGRCVFGARIDGEIGDLKKPVMTGSDNLGRHFLYARYDPNVADDGLIEMGLAHLTGRRFEMDDLSQLAALSTIGQQYAEDVDIHRDFPTFMPRAGRPSSHASSVDLHPANY